MSRTRLVVGTGTAGASIGAGLVLVARLWFGGDVPLMVGVIPPECFASAAGAFTCVCNGPAGPTSPTMPFGVCECSNAACTLRGVAGNADVLVVTRHP